MRKVLLLPLGRSESDKKELNNQFELRNHKSSKEEITHTGIDTFDQNTSRKETRNKNFSTSSRGKVGN